MKAKFSLVYSLMSPTLLKKLKRKDYRDAYMDAQVRTWVARQIRTLREQRGLSQAEMAEKIGKKQSVVSRLEDPDYGRATISTLLKISNALDIGLTVQFCEYNKAIAETRDVSKQALEVTSFDAEHINQHLKHISSLKSPGTETKIFLVHTHKEELRPVRIMSGFVGKRAFNIINKSTQNGFVALNNTHSRLKADV